MTKLVFKAAALLAVLSSSIFAAQKPNIVMIVADDLGYADIGVQAVSKDVRTPNIDSIAHDGVRFTAGYVSCPVCSPSRAGFLTGRYQEKFGHEANPLPKFDKIFGLPTDQTTIAAELKRNGYATGAFGKWHLGDSPQFHPQKRGFDEFFGFIGGAHSYTQSGSGVNQLRRNDTPVAEKEYLTDAITREAVSFIQHHKSEPFIAYVAYNAVHTPQEAPQKYQDRFADVKDHPRKMMLAMLSAADDGVGKILSTLRDNHLDKDTLVIFFSDNGGPTQANASRNAPFRGYKGQVWEGGIRIPFMMRWTSHIPPAQVIDHPVISLDIFPTALAAANITPRAELKLDGVNLLPWLTDKQAGIPHDTLYWRFKPAWALRDGNYKLLLALGETKTQLFDLAKDPGETTDLSAKKPEVVQAMQKKFDKWNDTLMKPLWPGRQEGAHQANGKPFAMSTPGLSGVSDD
jgi:arylsulfatase A-like enzyme